MLTLAHNNEIMNLFETLEINCNVTLITKYYTSQSVKIQI